MKSQHTRPGLGAALALICVSGGAQAFDPANPIPDPIAKGPIRIELEQIATGVLSPNYLTHAGDGSGRLFVVEQPGHVKIIQNGMVQGTPFLDASGLIQSIGLPGSGFDERGLLGLAFHPDFENNGKLYTFTSENPTGAADFTVDDPPPFDILPNETDPRRHHSVIREWTVDANNPDAVDPNSTVLMRIDNPQFNHNGGALTFGAGSDLFISVGDGGARDDNAPGHGPTGNGQNPANVLGTILRIDVDGNNSANGQYGIPQAAPFSTLQTDPTGTIPDEIYAFGFRNPFRTSYDAETGTLITGDVGQGDIEEVDIVEAGGNYGWRFKEGSFGFIFDGNGGSEVTDDLTGIPQHLLTDPVLEYDHDEGISVIGGFIYRGSAIPELVGKYVFGDFARTFTSPGRLFYGDLDTGLIQEFIIGLDDRSLDRFLKGFGVDAEGEIYALVDDSFAANSNLGEVLKIVAAPIPLPPAVWLFSSALGVFVARRRRD